MRDRLNEVYQRLFEAYGPQHWWPGESPFEVLVGAILVQNTSWQRVEAAIAGLKTQGVFDWPTLGELDEESLAESIRTVGYYRVKAKRLRNLFAMIHDRYDGSLEALLTDGTESLRENLLSVNGVGRETADSIVLYAAERPRFVIDAYTYRVFTRHGWVEPEIDYDELQDYFESALPAEVPLFNEYHALLVAVGHRHCKPRPKCDGCPLADMLPESGPILPDAEL